MEATGTWDSTESFVHEAADFGQFLEGAHQIPHALGAWVGGFMLLASKHKFFQQPRIWAPQPRKPGAQHTARVYFVPWSQNSLNAISGMRSWYFSAEDGDVFATYITDRVRVFGIAHGHLKFSGANTRAEFESAREAIEWLRSQLG